jgi:MFS transporter, FLVCR family, MFS-domain-containing protein 7
MMFDQKTPEVGLHEDTASASGSGSGSGSRSHPQSRPPPPQLTRSLSRITTQSTIEYKVYKRRFFGLFQLCLLNIVVSWDWIAFAPVSDTAAAYFNTTESIINWLSTAFLFAFVVATPFTFWTLHQHGPKLSISISAVLILAGNWIKYGGTRSNHFGVVMLGQLLIGFAQPFVLAAPTTYSNLWFSPSGRITATAVASLSNPFGAALGQLISPFWVSSDRPSDIPNMILYVAIISSIASLPSFFIPAKPPTPPSAGSTTRSPSHRTLFDDLSLLSKSPEFYLLFIPFSVFVGFFNAFSSLLNQILLPYGDPYTEDMAGIAGAILIVVGLVFSAVTSPLCDKYKFYLAYIKTSTPVIALSYLIFIWAPQSHSLAYVFVVCALLGAASFGLVPVALEFLVEIHYPLGPEVGSSLCWCGGQLLGGVFIVIMDALKAEGGRPRNNMKIGLVFQAVIALVAAILPICLGMFGRADRVRRRRLEADREGGRQHQIVDEEERGEGEVRI